MYRKTRPHTPFVRTSCTEHIRWNEHLPLQLSSFLKLPVLKWMSVTNLEQKKNFLLAGNLEPFVISLGAQALVTLECEGITICHSGLDVGCVHTSSSRTYRHVFLAHIHKHSAALYSNGGEKAGAT